MARYRRNATGWMSQPRGLNGRFERRSDGDPMGEWLARQKWWVVALVFVGSVVALMLLYYSGYILVFAACCFLLSLVLPLLAEPLALIAVAGVKVWRWAKGCFRHRLPPETKGKEREDVIYYKGNTKTNLKTMVIERLRIDEDLVEYLSSKGDVEKFVNFCIRERKEVLEQNYQKKRAVPAEEAEKRKVDADYRKFAEEVERKETPFYRKNVVITGTFGQYGDRNELAALLWEHGAAIKSGISSKTDLVVMGQGAGPKKMEQIKELQAGGQDITVVDESRLYEMLTEYGMV